MKKFLLCSALTLVWAIQFGATGAQAADLLVKDGVLQLGDQHGDQPEVEIADTKECRKCTKDHWNEMTDCTAKANECMGGRQPEDDFCRAVWCRDNFTACMQDAGDRYVACLLRHNCVGGGAAQ